MKALDLIVVAKSEEFEARAKDKLGYRYPEGKKIPTLRRLGSGMGVSRNNTTLRHIHVVCTRIIG